MRWFITLCFVFVCIGGSGQNKDTLAPKTDTSALKAPAMRKDTLRVSKDSLDAPITYSATDSIIMDVRAKKVILYNEASALYQDMDMKAYKIEVDQPKRIVVATYKQDSTGKMIGQPKFNQGENKMQADSITYNIDTKKGLTKSTYTQQGEMFIYGEKIKKVSENDYFAYRGRFTTCNLDTPHFAFVANKMKLVNKKMAVSGPVHPEFEGVPLPIYLPFGIFPISQGRHSGLLPPQFATNEQYGLGLEGLGYYKVLNDNFDATIRTNLYSYGGYLLNLSSNYIVRYRFNGGLNLSYQNVRMLSTGGTKEFNSTKVFNIRWNHAMNAKARPGTTFSASVNAGSTKYNQYIANNPAANFQNMLSSSIAYSKLWDNKYNLTLTANHSQNSNTRLINLNLPDIAFNATTLYPFQSRDMVGTPKWYQSLGIGLTSNIKSQASFYDSAVSLKQLIDTAQWGAQHTIPVQFSFPAFGPFQMSPGVSYTERWYDRQFIRSWNNTTNKVDTTVLKGFYSDRSIAFNLGLNLTTALYGIYNFNKNSRVKAIRHVIRPSFGLGFTPDLSNSKNYYTTRVDTAGTLMRFSKYEGSIFGAFGQGGGPAATINFGIDNNVEMKVRSKTDTSASGDHKKKLIDAFGFRSSYNLLADSFNLAPFALQFSSSALFDKINISANANLDPYQVDQRGNKINKYTWSGGKFSPGRITNGGLTIGSNFQSKQKDANQSTTNNTSTSNNIPMTPEEQAQMDYVRSHPAEFANFNIPWSFNFSYTLSFQRVLKQDYSGYQTDLSSGLNLGGSFNLTPRWQLQLQSYYDVKYQKIQSISLGISREMHCWQMTINVIPVGIVRSFNITINPRSSILRDLKVNRSRSFYGGN